MKLEKQKKFYLVILDSYIKDGEYHIKIKQRYWNNRKWKARKREWH